MSARKLTDEARKQAIAYCDFYCGRLPRPSDGSEAASDAAAHATEASIAWISDSYPWAGAAALLRAGWSPGEAPSSAQRLAAAVAVSRCILTLSGADVAIRYDVTPAVGAALAGPVTATYTITATGDAT